MKHVLQLLLSTTASDNCPTYSYVVFYLYNHDYLNLHCEKAGLYHVYAMQKVQSSYVSGHLELWHSINM